VKNIDSERLIASIKHPNVNRELVNDSYIIPWLTKAGELTKEQFKAYIECDDQKINTDEYINPKEILKERITGFPYESIRDLSRETPLSVCFCIGPIYGDQHCPCKMRQLGLTPSEEHLQARLEHTHNLISLMK
jgi:hypothetical protein